MIGKGEIEETGQAKDLPQHVGTLCDRDSAPLTAPGRVAVVHDWMFSRRGGEKVLERILNLFPHADLFVLFGNPETVLKTHRPHKVFRSFLHWVPGIEKHYKMLLPLFPLATESHDLSGYDLVLSSSACAAKGVICHPGAVHVSYLHSPMRYAWDMETTYFPGRAQWARPLHLLRKFLLSRLRIWDVTSSARVDTFCANSNFVARRAQLYYRRASTTVYPPVDLHAFSFLRKERPKKQLSVLLFGAWVPYKKMDVALRELHQLNLRRKHRGLPTFSILAAGNGQSFSEAQKTFGSVKEVEFFPSPSLEQLQVIFKKSHLLAYPGVEDFGIAPVEAMAAGLWVVGPDKGGTLETISQGVTGKKFQAGNMDDFLKCVEEVLEWNGPEETADFLNHLARFSQETFDHKFMQVVGDTIARTKTNNTGQFVPL